MANRNVEKGKRFERRVAQMLEKALGYKFFRSVVNSTTAMHSDRKIYGDVICSNPDFQFCIECKSYKSFSIDAVLLGGYDLLAEFFQQAAKQANSASKSPLLLVTNGKRTYAFFSISDFDPIDPYISVDWVGGLDCSSIAGMEFNRFLTALKD